MLDEEILQGIEKIRKDRVHGARELSLDALKLLRDLALKMEVEKPSDLIKGLEELGKEIFMSRPSMGVLRNRIFRVVYEANQIYKGEKDPEALRRDVVDRIDALITEAGEVLPRIASHASKLIEYKTVMTHSYSSTVVEVIQYSKDRVLGVIVTESRPLYEGRNAAKAFAEMGLPVTLISDAAMGYFTSQADVVLVGADSVLIDGSIVNKIGTQLMALAAREAGLPFYSACEKGKFLDISPEEVELEEKDGVEIMEKQSGVTVKNLYFDLTPSKLVTGIITEDGVIEPREVERLIRRMAWLYSPWGLYEED